MPTPRLARAVDQDDVLNLVSSLLVELGAPPPLLADLEPVFHSLITDGDAGFIVVGGVGTDVSAVCTVSFAGALRSRGRYAIIQEMYVKPEERSAGVGMAVLRFALDHAAANGCRLVELGTPAAGARQIRFYERAGFENVGARLRWRP